MEKKVIYRTVIEIEVLSEEPIPEDMSLNDIEDECNTGSFSGVHDYKITNEKLVGQDAVNATVKQGSSIDFFGMDEQGNELNDFSESDEETSFEKYVNGQDLPQD
jgi:hypothetical protein